MTQILNLINDSISPISRSKHIWSTNWWTWCLWVRESTLLYNEEATEQRSLTRSQRYNHRRYGVWVFRVFGLRWHFVKRCSHFNLIWRKLVGAEAWGRFQRGRLFLIFCFSLFTSERPRLQASLIWPCCLLILSKDWATFSVPAALDVSTLLSAIASISETLVPE